MRSSHKPERPLYRVTFSRIAGTDQDGNDILLRPKEIGAVWPRKNGKVGAILQLDIIPIELTQRQGVIFLVPAVEAEITENQERLDARDASRRGEGGAQ